MSLHIKGTLQKLRMQTLHVGTEYFLDISFGKMFNWGKKKNTRFEGFFIDREYYNEVRIV